MQRSLLPTLGALSLSVIAVVVWAEHVGAAQSKAPSTTARKSSPAVSVVQRYAEALAAGDRIVTGRLDFACLYRLVSSSSSRIRFPSERDPYYEDCWERFVRAHATAVEWRDPGLDVIWPGKGSLVFFAQDLSRYAPSFFVMSRLGTSPPGSGLQVEGLDSVPIPAASFRLRDDGPTVAAKATKVRLRITYKDPITSPISFAPGAYQWRNTVQRPKQALKTLTVSFIALSGLKKMGFPTDVAVMSLPVLTEEEPGGPIPFVTDRGGFQEKSAMWWGPGDAPGLLIASVGRASHFPDLRERVAMLNRVLLIDPYQAEALTLLTQDLYEALLAAATELHQISLTEPQLGGRFNQLYWDTYAQTTRTEISLGMEVGGFAAPTPADYLFRLIPAMERLAKARPEDLENRLRLGIAYRWNNDQQAAIETHEALINELSSRRATLQARALIELAWSRIAKVSWNRTFDDPGIGQAYREAEKAFELADQPLDKFAAAYTMAYSLMFTPNRNNHQVLEKLTLARDWYLKVPGATPTSWRLLLENDTLKGLVETDPAFQPLLTEVRIAE